MSHLPQREFEILAGRREGLTWGQIGEIVGLTKERVRQLHAQAEQRLLEEKVGRINSPQRFYHLERFGEQTLSPQVQVITVRSPSDVSRYSPGQQSAENLGTGSSDSA